MASEGFQSLEPNEPERREPDGRDGFASVATISDTPPGAPRKVGSYLVDRDPRELVLRLDSTSSVPLQGCAFLLIAMGCVLFLGVAAVVAQTRDNLAGDASGFFAPKQNHFGFMWLFCTIALLVGTPLYLRHIYKSQVTFAFRRSDGAVLRDNVLLARWDHVECLRLREVPDPDKRFLYEVSLMHHDGIETLIQNGYDEREAMNLANEISTFIHKPVVWK